MIIIIATFIIQSFILSLYYGITKDSEHYYLLLDFVLLIGLGGQKILLPLLIGSLCLSNEFLDFNNDLKQYYISMRLILSFNILLGKQKLIYFIFALVYLLFRFHYYLLPMSYLTIFGYIIIVTQKNFEYQKQPKEQQTEQIFEFFSESLPISLCIIQEEQYTFMTNQFKSEYRNLTPSIIKNITSKSTKECLSTYLIKRKLSKNKFYQYYNQKKLENCTLEDYIGDLNKLFPTDIDVAEIIWKQQPAIMLIFQRQEEKEQLKNIEDLKKRDQYKDCLLTNVSHDFKTPIGGILAIVQTLEQIIDESTAKNLLQVLKNWAHLLLFNISDIIDFSRIQQNALRLINTTFYIQSVVQEMIDLIQIQAAQKGIVVEKKITFGDRLMYSDPNRIKQILLNLLSNSLKFTEKGKIDIVVDYKTSDTDDSQGKLITISVTDTGVGIPENIKPKLFQMYGTFDFTKNGSNQHGTGLGLMICKKLVGLLGPSDTIQLDSQVGVGTKFSFDVYINNDQRNQNSFAQKTNFFKSESKNADNATSNQYISSQFTIFQKSSDFNISLNSKKLNKKGIQTQYDIPDKKIPHSAQYFRSLPRKRSQKKTILKKDLQNVQTGNNVISLNIEDSDHSKTRNIEQYLELNNEVTYGSQKNRNITDNNSQLNTPIQRIDSSESPVVQPRDCKPLQFTETIDDMMKKLFPKPCFILVVDDSPVNVYAFRLILQKYEYITIEEAYNGEQALQKIKNMALNQIQYQFIFMDLTMPIMNGYEAIEQIRIMESKKLIERCFIIALSGYDDIKEKENCYRVGFDAFVSKPIKIVDIISVVNEVRNSK